MTGERLYERFTKAAKAQDCVGQWEADKSVLPSTYAPPAAWPFLQPRDRRVWNFLASTLKVDR